LADATGSSDRNENNENVTPLSDWDAMTQKLEEQSHHFVVKASKETVTEP